MQVLVIIVKTNILKKKSIFSKMYDINIMYQIILKHL